MSLVRESLKLVHMREPGCDSMAAAFCDRRSARYHSNKSKARPGGRQHRPSMRQQLYIRSTHQLGFIGTVHRCHFYCCSRHRHSKSVSRVASVRRLHTHSHIVLQYYSIHPSIIIPTTSISIAARDTATPFGIVHARRLCATPQPPVLQVVRKAISNRGGIDG
jgi:hypothetical protein